MRPLLLRALYSAPLDTLDVWGRGMLRFAVHQLVQVRDCVYVCVCVLEGGGGRGLFGIGKGDEKVVYGPIP